MNFLIVRFSSGLNFQHDLMLVKNAFATLYGKLWQKFGLFWREQKGVESIDSVVF